MTTTASKALAIQNLASTIRVLALVVGWVRLINAFEQRSAIPDDHPESEKYLPLPHKKQRGRPPSQATLQKREFNAKRPTWASTGASKKALPIQTDLLRALQHYWQLLRQDYGLDHITMPDALVLKVIALDEQRIDALHAGTPPSPQYLRDKAEVDAELEIIRKRIREGASAGGTKPRSPDGFGAFNKKVPGLLNQLKNREIVYKKAIRKIEQAGVSSVPSDRTLRRWMQQISDMNLHQK
jgi:hypothetical protein